MTDVPNPSTTLDRDLLIALNTLPRLSRAALCRLGIELPAWRTLSNSDADARTAAELGVRRGTLARALALRPDAAARSRAEAMRAAEAFSAETCHLLTLADPDYPAGLLDHPLPPPVLSVRTREPEALATRFAAPAVAIVGSRKMSAYGAEVARLFAGGLARAGVVVVSGFAIGIDRTAHRAALDAGGVTFAVLGCGLDIDYPRGSRRLADDIAASGALISEFAFGTTPRAWHFPVRNRAIAALADATLVIEAKPRSGSLVTAHRALELGREVFAVPGRIVDDLSLGTNELIADGATPALSVDDVLDALSLPRLPQPDPGAETPLFGASPTSRSAAHAEARATSSHGGHHVGPLASPRAGSRVNPPQTSPPLPLPPGLGGVLVGLLARGSACGPEDLAERAEAPLDQVLGALLELELEGWVERLPGPRFAASARAGSDAAAQPATERT